MASKLRSIFTDDLDHCILTKQTPVHIHHVFAGKNRKLSEEDGFIVPLHPDLHNMSNKGVHFNRELDLLFKKAAQTYYEDTHTRREFIKRYGRSFL